MSLSPLFRAPIVRRGFVVLALLAAGCSSTAPATSTSAPSSASTSAPTTAAKAASPSAAAAASPMASPAAAPSAAASSAGASTSGSVAPLKVAYVAGVGAMAPLWMADASGAFKKRNVNVTVSLIDSQPAVAALLSGDVDAVEISAAPVITADAHGADLVFIGSGLNHAIFSLLVKKDITSAAQLKGKKLGSDKAGTPIDYGTQLLLHLLNLKPSDLQILPLGTNGDLPGLVAGQIDAATLAPPQTFQAEDQGFRDLKDTYDQPYQNVGLAVRKSRIAQLRPSLIRLLAAYRDGVAAYNSNETLAKQVLQKYTKISDPALLQRTYNFYKAQAPFQTDLQPTMPGTQAMITFLGQTLPQVKDATPQQYWDTSLLAQLPAQ